MPKSKSEEDKKDKKKNLRSKKLLGKKKKAKKETILKIKQALNPGNYNPIQILVFQVFLNVYFPFLTLFKLNNEQMTLNFPKKWQ